MLVFENSFSPAVDSPRRPIKKSLTPTGTHTATREKPTRFWETLSKSQDTQRASPPTPGTSARVRRARETKRGSPHGSRARQHTASLRAKLFCLHHPNRHLGDAPREGCACERADPPRGACFPSEQGLEHSIFDFRLVVSKGCEPWYHPRFK